MRPSQSLHPTVEGAGRMAKIMPRQAEHPQLPSPPEGGDPLLLGQVRMTQGMASPREESPSMRRVMPVIFAEEDDERIVFPQMMRSL